MKTRSFTLNTNDNDGQHVDFEMDDGVIFIRTSCYGRSTASITISVSEDELTDLKTWISSL